MMAGFDPTSFETLNAYVDGELDADAAAEVAEALARHPSLASTVAALSKSKAVLRTTVERDPELLPERPLRISRLRRVGLGMAAALVAVSLGLGGTAWWWGQGTGRPSLAQWQVEAEGIHQSWVANLSEDRPENLIDHVALKAPLAPNLAAAKLRLVHRSVQETPEGGWIGVMGYRGTRGCRLTLVISDRDRFFGAEAPNQLWTLSYRRWQTEAFGFVLLNQGMPDGRFAVIAAAMQEMTETWSDPDDETVVALQESRNRSEPCSA